MLLRRLAVLPPIPPPTGGSVTTGAAGSVTPAPVLSAATSQSSIEGPPSTSGVLPRILDSGASFHMTPDRTRISFICPSLFYSLFKLLMAHLFRLLVVALFHPLFSCS